MKQANTGSSNAVKWAVTGFPWSGSGFDLTRGMKSTYRGSTGKRVSLVAAAQSPGNLDPGRGSTSAATSSTAKDAGTSSHATTFGSVFCFAQQRRVSAGSAASSQGSTGRTGTSALQRDLQSRRWVLQVFQRIQGPDQYDPPVTVPSWQRLVAALQIW